jgi:hypothetical protein
MISTAVSSKMIRAMAEAEGFQFHDGDLFQTQLNFNIDYFINVHPLPPIPDSHFPAHTHIHTVLTGFKWIGNKAISLREEGVKVLFGYEEAIGFMVGDCSCPDKDGTLTTKKGDGIGEEKGRLEGHPYNDRHFSTQGFVVRW